MELEVKGMTCGGCSAGVEKAVRAMDGVSRCDVSLSAETASIDFDATVTTAEQIIERVSKMGYAVQRRA